MKKNSTRTLTQLGILTAIIVVMAFTPLGYIRTAGLSITLLHIPVIVGAALIGPVGGVVLGTVFGLTSLFQCFGLEAFGTTLMTISPIGCIITCLLPRILFGWLAAVLYRLFAAKAGKLGCALTGAVATLCHTLMFMTSLSLFFYGSDYLQSIATGLGVSNVFAFVLAFVGINGLLEIALAAVVTAALVPVLKKTLRT